MTQTLMNVSYCWFLFLTQPPVPRGFLLRLSSHNIYTLFINYEQQKKLSPFHNGNFILLYRLCPEGRFSSNTPAEKNGYYDDPAKNFG